MSEFSVVKPHIEVQKLTEKWSESQENGGNAERVAFSIVGNDSASLR
jgi:hypothetical protein